MKFVIDHTSSTPLHIQAEQLIRELIKQPEYQAGKLLPNEIDLSQTLSISRTTIRHAINTLVNEELLVRKKKVGTKVAHTRISSKSVNWLSFSQEMKARGIPLKNYELHVSWVYPEEHIANFLEVKTDKKILKMERLRGSTEEPFVYFISYFHPRIGLTGEEDFKLPLYEILQKYFHTTAVLSKEEINARNAEKWLAVKLEIESGSAILRRKRYVYDQLERPMEYNIGYYKADSFTYTVESRRI